MCKNFAGKSLSQMYKGDSYIKIWEVGGEGPAILVGNPPVCSPLVSGRKPACLSLEGRGSVSTGTWSPGRSGSAGPRLPMATRGQPRAQGWCLAQGAARAVGGGSPPLPTPPKAWRLGAAYLCHHVPCVSEKDKWTVQPELSRVLALIPCPRERKPKADSSTLRSGSSMYLKDGVPAWSSFSYMCSGPGTGHKCAWVWAATFKPWLTSSPAPPQVAAKQAAAAATQTIAASQNAAVSNKNPAAQQQLVQSCKVRSQLPGSQVCWTKRWQH